MSSNLACIGLAVTGQQELSDLLERASAAAQPVGTFGGVRVVRWQDPSGAALVVGWRARQVTDLMPTYASTAGGTLADCRLVSETVATATVVDADGRQLTAMAFGAEQYRQLKAFGRAVAGPARITALGVSVTVHKDAAAFAAAPDSLVDPARDPNEQPPPHVAERGLAWPPRVAAESFIPYGVFGDAADSTPLARMSGTVLRARRHTCELTGQEFAVATVRSVGFEADLCLSGTDHPVTPEPGNIIGGTVFLVATVESEALTSYNVRGRGLFRRGPAPR